MSRRPDEMAPWELVESRMVALEEAPIKISKVAGLLYALDRYRDAVLAPRPLAEWDESVGPVLWWRFPVVEPPHCGSPLDDDFPDYVTHWTRFAVPSGVGP